MFNLGAEIRGDLSPGGKQAVVEKYIPPEKEDDTKPQDHTDPGDQGETSPPDQGDTDDHSGDKTDDGTDSSIVDEPTN